MTRNVSAPSLRLPPQNEPSARLRLGPIRLRASGAGLGFERFECETMQLVPPVPNRLTFVLAGCLARTTDWMIRFLPVLPHVGQAGYTRGSVFELVIERDDN